MEQRTGIIAILVIIVLDQLTKHFALTSIMEGTAIPVLSFFNLVLVWNVGISFGMLQHGHDLAPYILSGVALIVCLWLWRWLRDAETRGTAAALGLIIGGAIGNVIDRLIHGAVVDFLDFHAFGHHSPAFNVADASVCIGVFMLLLGGRHKSA